MKTVDIIITHGYVFTMEGEGTGCIPDGAVAIHGNRITAVGKTEEICKEYSAHRYIDAANKAVLPGFIDTHVHSTNAIMRGCSQDINKWMYSGILPLLGLATTEDLVAGSMLNIIESVKNGTTTFCDYDFPMLEVIKNHVKVGTRAYAAEMINELPSVTYGVMDTSLRDFDPAKGEKQLSDAVKLIEEYHESQNGRIKCMFGPQATEMVSVPLLKEIKSLSKKYGVDIHMHVAQSERETRQVQERYGLRPVELLDRLGYLDSHLHAAHIIETTDAERKLMAEKGVSMALCTASLGIIDGILPPAQEYMQYNGRVGLGTDQAPGNNCMNMFNEMKFTALMHKYKNQDPTIMPAWKVLRMATIEAAEAMNMNEEIGSLKSGKKADIILVDLDAPAMSPVFDWPVRNIVPNLVYSANGSEVSTVIIDGNIIVEDGILLTVNEEEEISKVNKISARLSRELGQKSWSSELPLAILTAERKY